MQRCKNCNGCVDCTKNVKKSAWSKCLDKKTNNSNANVSLCPPKPKISINNVNMPNASSKSKNMRNAQKLKILSTGHKWRTAKWDRKKKAYIIGGAVHKPKSQLCSISYAAPTYLKGEINKVTGEPNKGLLIMTFTKPVLIPGNPGSNPDRDSFTCKINGQIEDYIDDATFDAAGNVVLTIQKGNGASFLPSDIVMIYYIALFDGSYWDLPKIGDAAGNLVESFSDFKSVQNNF